MDRDSFEQSLKKSHDIKAEASKITQYKDQLPLNHKKARFPGFRQGTRTFAAGYRHVAGGLALPSSITMLESVPMKLSDGITIYSDVFLPADSVNGNDQTKFNHKLPALIAWSPYGKQAGNTILNDFPFRAGVPQHWLSDLQKWEGPDPAAWCPAGYAVVNVDIRGSYTSEGDFTFMGLQEAQDGAEFVTWVSEQAWCSGKVALTGNSWLAISQWKIASLRPKGLAAISPWEGHDDFYRDSVCAGGVPSPGFHNLITSTFCGKGKLEDAAAALSEHPLWHPYWEDKVSRVERINVPCYVVASWTSAVHSKGTFRAYSNLPGGVPKWFRVHNTQEWPDYYAEANRRDLQRFFDYYLKGHTENGWLSTPCVRLSVLNHNLLGHFDTVNRPESEWPMARTQYVRYYLEQHNTLSTTVPTGTGATVEYDAKSGRSTFLYTIPDDIETTGYFMAHLNISCKGHNDADVFVQLEKLNQARYKQGTPVMQPQGTIARGTVNLLHNWNILVGPMNLLFGWGPNGLLRAGHALDKVEGCADHNPMYTHTRRVPLKPNEKGDVLRLTITGKPVNPFPLPGVAPMTDNAGTHVIEYGGQGKESSYLLMPQV